MRWGFRTQDVGGEFPEPDVPSALLLAVIQDLGHEGVGVEGDGAHDRQRRQPHAPAQPSECVRQRQDCGADDRRREMEPRVPPTPCNADVHVVELEP